MKSSEQLDVEKRLLEDIKLYNENYYEHNRPKELYPELEESRLFKECILMYINSMLIGQLNLPIINPTYITQCMSQIVDYIDSQICDREFDSLADIKNFMYKIYSNIDCYLSEVSNIEKFKRSIAYDITNHVYLFFELNVIAIHELSLTISLSWNAMFMNLVREVLTTLSIITPAYGDDHEWTLFDGELDLDRIKNTICGKDSDDTSWINSITSIQMHKWKRGLGRFNKSNDYACDRFFINIRNARTTIHVYTDEHVPIHRFISFPYNCQGVTLAYDYEDVDPIISKRLTIQDESEIQFIDNFEYINVLTGEIETIVASVTPKCVKEPSKEKITSYERRLQILSVANL